MCSSITFAGMTSADTTAASSDLSASEPKASSLRKWLAPIEPTPDVVRTFLLIDAATILLLVGIIFREVWQMVQARRRGRAAARLHVQIVSLFSVIALLPAVLVAVVANVTIDRGLDRLFSGPTRQVIQNSLVIANAYLYEHAELIRGDILG